MQDSSLDDSITLNEDDFEQQQQQQDAQPAPRLPPSRRSATAQEMQIRLRPTILLLGDSLTEYGFGRQQQQQQGDDDETQDDVGWASLLCAAYTRRADVLNRGFAGYNTEWILNIIMPQILGAVDDHHHSNVLLLFAVVWLGANDAAVPAATNCQHVPVEQYQANLTAILRLLRNRVKQQQQEQEPFPILLLTPPPVDEDAWKQFLQDNFPEALEETAGESNRQNSVTRAYGQAAKKAAGTDPSCAVLDVWELLEGETEHRGKYLSDGLHLNADGNRKVYHGIMETIQKHFPKIAPMEDGDGKYGTSGVPVEEKLWKELAGIYENKP